MNENTLFTVIVFGIVAIIFFIKTVKRVNQGEEWVVERLGKFHKILLPGLRFVLPFVDVIAYKITTKDIILDVEKQEVITRDNAVIEVNAISYIKVTDPVKAVYGVQNFAEAIRYLIMTTLRSIVGEMELNEALASRERIKARLRDSITDEAVDWGLTVKSVEIQDIRPTASMVKSMELQAAAQRERTAAVTKAEGEKQAAILQAEARLEAARLDAAAAVSMANGQAEALQLVAKSLGDNPISMTYILGDKYIQALQDMASNPNSKLIMLPADLQATLTQMFNKKTN